MIYTEFRNTRKMLSKIGFGGMRFDLSQSDETCAELVSYAFEKGINYFDTAPTYCSERSELIFSHAFKHMKRADYFVADKSMPERASTTQESYDRIRRSIDRMQVDYIDFFYIWCIRTMQQYRQSMVAGGHYEGILRAQAEGLIKHICVSSHLNTPENIQIIDEDKVEAILMGANILNLPYRLGAFEHAVDKGLFTLCMNPLAGGVIPQFRDKFEFLAGDDYDAAQGALRFVFSSRAINLVLCGFNKKCEVDSACYALENLPPTNQAEMEALRIRLAGELDNVCTACGYCDGCPQHIPISPYMQFYNNKAICSLSDKEMSEELAFQRVWGILNGAEPVSKCTGCGKCEKNCTQKLKIIAALKYIDKL